jgi:hypothetical protein
MMQTQQSSKWCPNLSEYAALFAGDYFGTTQTSNKHTAWKSKVQEDLDDMNDEPRR